MSTLCSDELIKQKNSNLAFGFIAITLTRSLRKVWIWGGVALTFKQLFLALPIINALKHMYKPYLRQIYLSLINVHLSSLLTTPVNLLRHMGTLQCFYAIFNSPVPSTESYYCHSDVSVRGSQRGRWHWRHNLKFYIQVFLCYGQGTTRWAILYGDRSCYIQEHFLWLPFCFHGLEDKVPPKWGLLLQERICILGSTVKGKNFLPTIFFFF